MSEKIEVNQIKSAFVSNNQEQTNVDVEEISEKIMVMIKEQDQERGTGRRTRDSRVGKTSFLMTTNFYIKSLSQVFNYFLISYK